MATVARVIAVVLSALGLGAVAVPSRAPAGVSSIRVRSAAGVTIVTRPASVLKIVRWLDALPPFVARPCPYARYQPPDVRFVFRGSGTTRRAVAHLPGTCAGSITSGGRVYAEDGFVARVSRLVGVDFGANAKTAAHRRLAKRDAAKILRLAVLPSGSHRLTRAPSAALRSASSLPGTTALVDVHAIWKMHLPYRKVAAFEQAHPPRGGARPAGSGFASGPTSSTQLMFSFRALHGRVSSRELVINVAPLAHGWTGVRVDAQDVWVVSRDPDETLPAGVRAISVRRSNSPAGRVTASADVARIVRWFDALPVVQPWVYHCPLLRGPHMTVSFLGKGGTVLATAAGLNIRGLSGPCAPIDFRVYGVAQHPLMGGHFFGRVKRLAR